MWNVKVVYGGFVRWMTTDGFVENKRHAQKYKSKSIALGNAALFKATATPLKGVSLEVSVEMADQDFESLDMVKGA